MKRTILNLLITIGLITIANANVLAHVKTGSPVKMFKKCNQYDFYYTAANTFDNYFVDGSSPGPYYAILFCQPIGWSVDPNTPYEPIDVTFRIFRTGDDPNTSSSTLTRTFSGGDFFDIREGILGDSSGNNNGTFNVPLAGEWISNGGTFSIEMLSAVGETSSINYNIIAN